MHYKISQAPQKYSNYTINWINFSPYNLHRRGKLLFKAAQCPEGPLQSSHSPVPWTQTGHMLPQPTAPLAPMAPPNRFWYHAEELVPL